jgi:hypothetical protein
MQPQDKQVTKKTYQSPQLIVYGDIKELTQAGGAGTRDNPTDPTSRMS